MMMVCGAIRVLIHVKVMAMGDGVIEGKIEMLLMVNKQVLVAVFAITAAVFSCHRYSHATRDSANFRDKLRMVCD